MTQPVDFYFDFSSPYGYMASTQIEALAGELGREVHWRPILLGPMFKAMGSAPLTEIPLKGDYARHDFARSALLSGIAYTHPDKFPIGTVAAARAVLYMQQQDPIQAVDLIKALYAAYFVEGRDIGDAQVVLDVAQARGLDRAALAQGIAQESIKNQLKEQVQQAMARGVFGSPFVIIDGEPFWGFDRFGHIRAWAQRQA